LSEPDNGGKGYYSTITVDVSTPQYTTDTKMMNDDPYPYKCSVEIPLPTPAHANDIKRLMEVDKEVGDRVKKVFDVKDTMLQVYVPCLVPCLLLEMHILHLLYRKFEATHAKWLRVSVSSFYEFLTVSLRCYQQFDDSLRTEEDAPSTEASNT